MINSVEMINFKSFSKNTLDFTQKNNKTPKKLVSIYGENGSGKSNIVDAFKILKFSTMTTFYSEKITTFQSLISDQVETDKIKMIVNIHDVIQAPKYRDLDMLLKDTHRINSEDKTTLVFRFTINKTEGSYEISYDNKNRLVSESLYYLINKKRGTLFEIKKNGDNLDIELNHSTFKTASIRNELEDSIMQLWGKHTLIAIFKQFERKINKAYINKNISLHFKDVLSEFDKLVIWTDEIKGPFSSEKSLFPDLASGSISKKDEGRLIQLEEVIYAYFSSLYADIKDVKYKIKENDSKIDYQLYVMKNISGKETEVPFYLESNGTKKLLELLRVFFSVIQGHTVIVDEIDQGIHDILMNNIIKNVSESINGQLIFTTHDTFLLRELPVSSVYFINMDVMGNKLILSGNDYDKKVLKNNNMQNMYLKGMFNAVPDPLDIDFDDIFSSCNCSW